jgi:predicted Zn-dependent protease
MRLALVGVVLTIGAILISGCMPPQESGHRGPGGRSQPLALTPLQELELGRQAYREVLKKAEEAGRLLPKSNRRTQQVRHVGQKIIETAKNRLLQREIHLDLSGYQFEPDFRVIESSQVNAFCLPACKVAVFTGLFQVVENDDQLAAVLGHEVAHALAHHASERIARANMRDHALQAVNSSLGGLSPTTRKRLIGLLAGGAEVSSRSYDRQQEAEADHIGLFLMKFAGYDPQQALRFWQHMQRLGAERPRPPAILSTHPSDAERLRLIQEWIPNVEGAYRAWKEGNVVKEKS